MIRIEQDGLQERVKEMVERASLGETVIITRGGVAVAQLEPMPPASSGDIAT